MVTLRAKIVTLNKSPTSTKTTSETQSGGVIGATGSLGEDSVEVGNSARWGVAGGRFD